MHMSGVFVITNQIRCYVQRDGQKLVHDLARKTHEVPRLQVLQSIRDRLHAY